MDFKKAFTFMLTDNRWGINWGLGALISLVSSVLMFFLYKACGLDITTQNVDSATFGVKTSLILFTGIFLISIVGQILYTGYMILLTRNCNNLGIEKILPDWVFNFKSILKNGSKFFLACVIFSIVFYSVLAIITFIYILITGLVMAIVKPLGILLMICGFILILLLALFWIVFFPALCLVYLDEDTLLCLFNFKKAFNVIKVDERKFFGALLLVYGTGIVSYIVMALLCMSVGGILGGIIGGVTGNIPLAGIAGYFAGAIISAFLTFYIMCVCAYIIGQVYKNYKLKTQA